MKISFLLLVLTILLYSNKSLSYNAGRSLRYPLAYIDHSIDTRSSTLHKENKLLPTGKCEDMKERDLSLFIPGSAPRSLYPGFIDNYRVSCLSLADSFIENIAVGSFDCLSNLLYLDLSKNRINLCDLTFGGHNKLRTLVLDENNYNVEHDKSLILSRVDCFPHLEHLYLRKNKLRGISASLPQNLPALTHLYLSDNQLEGRTFDYLKLPFTLTHLHLERNWIFRIDSPELINLSSLFLDGNKIESICHWQCHSGTDAYLNLRRTNQLQLLSLTHNRISYIECDSFQESRYLKSLKLDHNKIGSIAGGTFNMLQELRDLSLSYNCLTSLPDFRNNRMLTSLYLDHNLLQTIPAGIFCNLYHLKWLSLGSNNIRNIALDAFLNLPALEELDLSNNQLSHLPYNWIDRNTCLKHLDMRGNYFRTIDSISIGNMRCLRNLYLQGNPLVNYWEPSSWKYSNIHVHLNYNSSMHHEPCYTGCGYENVISRSTFGEEWWT